MSLPTVSCAQPEPSIPVCKEDRGLYCCKKEQFDKDKCKNWILCQRLRNIMKYFQSQQFFVQANRTGMKELWEKLDLDSPFQNDQRFPLRGEYVVIKDALQGAIDQILSALDYRSLVQTTLTISPELAKSITADLILRDNERGNQAKLSFDKGIAGVYKALDQDNYIFERESFEKRTGIYGAVWVHGDQDCSITALDLSHLSTKHCCTFLDIQLQMDRASNRHLNIYFDPKKPYTPRRVVNIRSLMRLFDVNPNQILPNHPIFAYSTNDSLVYRVSVDEDCVATWQAMYPFENRNRPVGDSPTFQQIQEEIQGVGLEDDEDCPQNIVET